MMSVMPRPYAGEADLPLIAELIRSVPPTGRHLVDFPWRMCAPTLDPLLDARLWTVDGVAVGFAAWRIWWAALDFYVRPGPSQAEVEAEIFAWAPQRFRELDAVRGQPLPYWVEARDDNPEGLALLARHGYTLDHDYAYVMLSRDLAAPLPRPDPPPGFTIRPLAGTSETDAYVALHRRAFASTSMTAEWRTRALRMPQYDPELDLVAVAPNGQLAGFCVGWAAPERRLAQIEPLGIDPEIQGKGLGRALLLEMLARFQAHGAEYAQVETETTRFPALRAYQAVGLQPIYRSLRKGQWFTRHDGLGEDR